MHELEKEDLTIERINEEQQFIREELQPALLAIVQRIEERLNAGTTDMCGYKAGGAVNQAIEPVRDLLEALAEESWEIEWRFEGEQCDDARQVMPVLAGWNHLQRRKERTA